MKKNIIRIILSILLIGTFNIIFGFSGQNGEESSGVSRKVTQFIVENILHTPEETKIQTIEQLEGIVRKLAHFSIYTVVGILLMGLISTYNIEEMKRIYISIVIGIIYATSDEIHQFFIPGRAAKFTDVMIDTMGVALGITLVLLFLKILEKNRHKKCQKSPKNV